MEFCTEKKIHWKFKKVLKNPLQTQKQKNNWHKLKTAIGFIKHISTVIFVFLGKACLAGYFAHVHKYLLFEEDQFSTTYSCTDFGKQCSHCLLDKHLGERLLYRRMETQTYPYFSARSRASSSLTALWSVRSHLLPHRITSGLSQYAWICSWPER